MQAMGMLETVVKGAVGLFALWICVSVGIWAGFWGICSFLRRFFDVHIDFDSISLTSVSGIFVRVPAICIDRDALSCTISFKIKKLSVNFFTKNTPFNIEVTQPKISFEIGREGQPSHQRCCEDIFTAFQYLLSNQSEQSSSGLSVSTNHRIAGIVSSLLSVSIIQAKIQLVGDCLSFGMHVEDLGLRSSYTSTFGINASVQGLGLHMKDKQHRSRITRNDHIVQLTSASIQADIRGDFSCKHCMVRLSGAAVDLSTDDVVLLLPFVFHMSTLSIPETKADFPLNIEVENSSLCFTFWSVLTEEWLSSKQFIVPYIEDSDFISVNLTIENFLVENNSSLSFEMNKGKGLQVFMGSGSEEFPEIPLLSVRSLSLQMEKILALNFGDTMLSLCLETQYHSLVCMGSSIEHLLSTIPRTKLEEMSMPPLPKLKFQVCLSQCQVKCFESYSKRSNPFLLASISQLNISKEILGVSINIGKLRAFADAPDFLDGHHENECFQENDVEKQFLEISKIDLYLKDSSEMTSLTGKVGPICLRWTPALLLISPGFVQLARVLYQYSHSFESASVVPETSVFVFSIDIARMTVDFPFSLESGPEPEKVKLMQFKCKSSVLEVTKETSEYNVVSWSVQCNQGEFLRNSLTFLTTEQFILKGSDKIVGRSAKYMHTYVRNAVGSWDPQTILWLMRIIIDNSGAAICLRKRVYEIIWPECLSVHHFIDPPQPIPCPFPVTQSLWSDHPAAIKEFWMWFHQYRKPYLAEPFMFISLEVSQIELRIFVSEHTIIELNARSIKSEWTPHEWEVEDLHLNINESKLLSVKELLVYRSGDQSSDVQSNSYFSEEKLLLQDYTDVTLKSSGVHVTIPKSLDGRKLLYDLQLNVICLMTAIRSLPSFGDISQRFNGPEYVFPPSPPPPCVKVFLNDLIFDLMDDPWESWLQHMHPLWIEDRARQESLVELLLMKIHQRQATGSGLSSEEINRMHNLLSEMNFTSYKSRYQESLSREYVKQGVLLRASITSISVEMSKNGRAGNLHIPEEALRCLKEFDEDKSGSQLLEDYMILEGFHMNIEIHELYLHLRKLPIPLASIEFFEVSGPLIISKRISAFDHNYYHSTKLIDLCDEAPHEVDFRISQVPFKMFYDINALVNGVNSSCSSFYQFSIRDVIDRCLNGLIPGLANPSEVEPLELWDFFRYLFHGRIDVDVSNISFQLLYGIDCFDTEKAISVYLHGIKLLCHHSYIKLTSSEVSMSIKDPKQSFGAIANQLLRIPFLSLQLWLNWRNLLEDSCSHYLHDCPPSDSIFEHFKSKYLDLIIALQISSLDIVLNNSHVAPLIDAFRKVSKFPPYPYPKGRFNVVNFSVYKTADSLKKLFQKVSLVEFSVNELSIEIWEGTDHEIHPAQGIELSIEKAFLSMELQEESVSLIKDPQSEHSRLIRSQRILLPSEGNVWSLSNMILSVKNVEGSLLSNRQWEDQGDHSDRQQLLSRIHRGEVVICHTYENQRFYPRRGWSTSLLPTDRPKWSDIKGTTYLPKDHESFDLAPGWEWNGPWLVDHMLRQLDEVDPDGWEYASDFPRKFVGRKSWYTSVRRRRWIRLKSSSSSDFLRHEDESGSDKKKFVFQIQESILDQMRDDSSLVGAVSSYSHSLRLIQRKHSHLRRKRQNVEGALHASSVDVVDDNIVRESISDLLNHFKIRDADEKKIDNTKESLDSSDEQGPSSRRSSHWLFSMTERSQENTLPDETEEYSYSDTLSPEVTAMSAYKLQFVLKSIRVYLTLELRNSLFTIIDSYSKILREEFHVAEKVLRTHQNNLALGKNSSENIPPVHEIYYESSSDLDSSINSKQYSNDPTHQQLPDGDSDHDEIPDIFSDDEEILLAKLGNENDHQENILSKNYTDVENLIIVELLDPQISIESEEYRGRVLLHLGYCICETRALWGNFFKDSFEYDSSDESEEDESEDLIFKRLKLDSGIVVGGVECFVAPTSIDIHSKNVWLDQGNIKDMRQSMGLLKPVMNPMPISASVIYWIELIPNINFYSSSDPSNYGHNLTAIASVPRLEIKITSEQLSIISNVLDSVFSSPFPFQEALEEEIATLLYRGLLEVDPFKHAIELESQRNKLRWQIQHLKWLLGVLNSENGIPEEDGLPDLKGILEDLQVSVLDYDDDLKGMLAVCNRNQTTEGGRNPSELELRNTKRFSSIIRISVNFVDVKCLHSHTQEVFLETDMRDISLSLTVGDFEQMGILASPRYVDMAMEVSVILVTNPHGENSWFKLLTPFDGLYEDDPSRVMLSVQAVQRFVGGITVVPRFEINVAPLKVNLTNDIITFMIEFFTKSEDSETTRIRLVPQGRGVLGFQPKGTVKEVAIPREQKPAGKKSIFKMFKFNKNKNQVPVSERDAAVSQMKFRARQYINFNHIRCGKVKAIVSYKGGGQFNIEDFAGLTVRLRPIVYENKVWTLKRLTQKLKRDYSKALLSQVHESLGSFLKFKLGLMPKDKKEDYVEEEKKDPAASLVDFPFNEDSSLNRHSTDSTPWLQKIFRKKRTGRSEPPTKRESLNAKVVTEEPPVGTAYVPEVETDPLSADADEEVVEFDTSLKTLLQ